VTTPPQSAALVALLRLGRRPWPTYAALVEEDGSALAVLEHELAEPAGQTSLLTRDAGPDIARAQADIAAWRAAGTCLVTVLDDQYPVNLRGVHDRPPLIFVGGQIRAADTRAVAVIGSRRASAQGLETAATITQHLVAHGYTLVSGLATGIDAAAHRAALSAGGRTLAVVGTGLDRCYPSEHLPLQRQIADRGAVVSQFWPDSPPGRQTFPLRNVTMSGISLATVVVEASQTSGARIQARRALAHGRLVFLSRAVLGQPWGRELSRRPGVQVVDDASQVTAGLERLFGAGSLTA
jgi:DNA processing protein